MLEWRDEWTLHIDLMDADHRRLAQQLKGIGGRIERLTSAQGHRDGAALVADLETLAALTRQHFTREERIMRAVEYPYIDSHRDEHAVLLAECEAIVQDTRAGAVDWHDQAVLPALEHWLAAHILTDDQLLARYLRRSGMTFAQTSEPLILSSA
jgi:hemerythrin-like metal-binding protein